MKRKRFCNKELREQGVLSIVSEKPTVLLKQLRLAEMGPQRRLSEFNAGVQDLHQSLHATRLRFILALVLISVYSCDPE